MGGRGSSSGKKQAVTDMAAEGEALPLTSHP